MAMNQAFLFFPTSGTC